MSGQSNPPPVETAARPGTDPARCGRSEAADSHRCACGRLRDRCVRDTVHAVWSEPHDEPVGPLPADA
ncbi:hypothetical protein [Micromonospora coxensis]|uniref:Uncharacterized protein n=1 Tax=Micromonospora coxensis TaxID=356852 RepID=A0A1C5JET7_9ACTN|nr:hypothetical protein [Micromonospora coxensis]SCG69080.1 hypothetical protein GA0070614_4486 [Micromonospora coxensis]